MSNTDIVVSILTAQTIIEKALSQSYRSYQLNNESQRIANIHEDTARRLQMEIDNIKKQKK